MLVLVDDGATSQRAPLLLILSSRCSTPPRRALPTSQVALVLFFAPARRPSTKGTPHCAPLHHWLHRGTTDRLLALSRGSPRSASTAAATRGQVALLDRGTALRRHRPRYRTFTTIVGPSRSSRNLNTDSSLRARGRSLADRPRRRCSCSTWSSSAGVPASRCSRVTASRAASPRVLTFGFAFVFCFFFLFGGGGGVFCCFVCFLFGWGGGGGGGFCRLSSSSAHLPVIPLDVINAPSSPTAAPASSRLLHRRGRSHAHLEPRER